MSWTPLASSVSESYRKMTERKNPRHFCPEVYFCEVQGNYIMPPIPSRPCRQRLSHCIVFGRSVAMHPVVIIGPADHAYCRAERIAGWIRTHIDHVAVFFQLL